MIFLCVSLTDLFLFAKHGAFPFQLFWSFPTFILPRTVKTLWILLMKGQRTSLRCTRQAHKRICQPFSLCILSVTDFQNSKVLGTCIQGTLKWRLRGRRHKMLFESIIIALEFPFRIQVWWHTAVIPALSRLTQEDLEFENWLGYTVRPYLTLYPRRICLSVAKGRSQTGDLINKLSLQ